MTPESDFFLLQVKTVQDVTLARITTTELWSDQQVGAMTAELMHLTDDLGPAPRLVLDFACVTGLGSRMIGQLAALLKQVKAAGGRLALCNVRPEIAEVIETCKLTTLFGVHSDEESALAALAGNPV
jgi:anti-sigma B factor antagonist